MDKLTPADAADKIRDDFRTEPTEPDFLHRVKFAEWVCDALPVDRSSANTERVLKLLEKHGIDGSAYEAFPGWFENELGERAMCQDEAAKDAFMARSKDDAGLVPADQGSIDAHGKFQMGGPLRKRDIRATMPRYHDEKDIDEAQFTEDKGAPLHRIHPLGKGEPVSQRQDHMPDPNSLLLNPPNAVDPTHDNRPHPGDNPAANPGSKVEIPRPAGTEKTDVKREDEGLVL